MAKFGLVTVKNSRLIIPLWSLLGKAAIGHGGCQEKKRQEKKSCDNMELTARDFSSKEA
jgi:hypothetical protein